MAQSKQFSNRGMNVSKSEMTYTLYLAGIPQDQNVELNLYNHFCQFGTIKLLELGYNGNPSAAAVTFVKGESAKAANDSLKLPLNNSNIQMTLVPSNAITSEKPKCLLCDRRFADKWGLKEQIKRVHGETRYKCAACKAPFTSENMLKHHMTNIHSTGSHAFANKRNAKKCVRKMVSAESSSAFSDRTKDTVLPREQITSLQRKIEMNERKYFKALAMVETNKNAIERQLKRKCLLHSISLFQVILNYVFAYKITRERCSSEE